MWRRRPEHCATCTIIGCSCGIGAYDCTNRPPGHPTERRSVDHHHDRRSAHACGAITLHCSAGPFDIQPGQNNIDTKRSHPATGERRLDRGHPPRPAVYATAPMPRRRRGAPASRRVAQPQRGRPTAGLPQRFFAAGEEKTAHGVPSAVRLSYKTNDHWVLNYMLHNLTPKPRRCGSPTTIDFIPADAPEADRHDACPPGVDGCAERQGLPGVRRVPRAGDGTPSPTPTSDDPTPAVARRTNGPSIATARSSRPPGHLHPGGLHTDLWSNATGRRRTCSNPRRTTTSQPARCPGTSR